MKELNQKTLNKKNIDKLTKSLNETRIRLNLLDEKMTAAARLVNTFDSRLKELEGKKSNIVIAR